MRQPLSVDDYRAAARRRLPGMVFDYVDGGAEAERTVQANLAAFDEVALRPRGAHRARHISLDVSVLGQRLALPVILAPCGAARIVRPEGDLAGARAAGLAGTAFILSAMSGHEIGEVIQAGSGPVWFQLYDLWDWEQTQALVRRVADAGVSTMVVTIDTAAEAIRERDLRHGVRELLGPSRVRAVPRFLPLLGNPRWLADRIRDGVVPPLANVRGADGQPAYLGKDFIPRSLSWPEIRIVRSMWLGSLVVKGVLTPEDARRAVDEGASAVIVSNHGGRQLDGAEATLRALPEVANEVGAECEILIDGGIRRGTHVLKALAMGAHAVLIGRPWLYGLAVSGESGVASVLDLLKDSLTRNLSLLGCDSIEDLSLRHVRVPTEWANTVNANQVEDK